MTSMKASKSFEVEVCNRRSGFFGKGIGREVNKWERAEGEGRYERQPCFVSHMQQTLGPSRNGVRDVEPLNHLTVERKRK